MVMSLSVSQNCSILTLELNISALIYQNQLIFGTLINLRMQMMKLMSEQLSTADYFIQVTVAKNQC